MSIGVQCVMTWDRENEASTCSVAGRALRPARTLIVSVPCICAIARTGATGTHRGGAEHNQPHPPRPPAPPADLCCTVRLPTHVRRVWLNILTQLSG